MQNAICTVHEYCITAGSLQKMKRVSLSTRTCHGFNSPVFQLQTIQDDWRYSLMLMLVTNNIFRNRENYTAIQCKS